ncbi:MAG: hypothetical protein LIR50_14700 [Bacillota bacterium]|nr:hypothetical protein [Bacillota bacterium]
MKIEVRFSDNRKPLFFFKKKVLTFCPVCGILKPSREERKRGKKMINAKERFGYTYIITTDRVEKNIIDAFCEGKNFWWNCFLGWRKTRVENNGIESKYYWIPSNKVEILAKLAKEIKEKV